VSGAVKGRTGAYVVLLLLLATVASCYWTRYPELVETHLGLLEGLAADGRDMVQAGYGSRLHTGEIERFDYPLERAQQFAEISRRRWPDRGSLKLFDEVLAEYAVVLKLLREASADPSESVKLSIAVAVGRLEMGAAGTRMELLRESSESQR